MTEQPTIDERFHRPFYLMAKAVKMEEVPLLVVSEDDQWAFTTQASAVLGGTVVYSAAADARQQVLASIVAPGYLFLVIEQELERELYDFLRYYLGSRDVLGELDSLLERRFQATPIHPDHRLIQIVDRDVLAQQPMATQRYLRELSTAIAVS